MGHGVGHGLLMVYFREKKKIKIKNEIIERRSRSK